MGAYEDSIKVNGAAYFSFQNAQGEWVNDPLEPQARVLNDKK